MTVHNSTQAITVEFDVPARMRDGVTLRADIYRPAGDGRWPVLLMRLPYGKSSPPDDTLIPHEAARHGYVVIVQDTRGRSSSEGDWYPYRSEADDGEDTVAWAAQLPYSDGQVGMFGKSYMGFTQWAAAVRLPPALKAMSPVMTWVDPLNGVIARGGARELGLGASWSIQMGVEELIRRHQHNYPAMARAVAMLCREIDELGTSGYRELPLSDFGPLRRHDIAPAFFDAVAGPLDRTRSPISSASTVDQLDTVHIPALHVGGWYDVFLGNIIASYERLRAQGTPAKLLIGPWTHSTMSNPVGDRNFGLGAQGRFIDLQTNLAAIHLRWFNHWLKGLDTGVMTEPPVKIFVMGANVWRDELEWPLARAVATPWYLHAGGLLSVDSPAEEAPDRYVYDPADPVPTRGGALLMTPEYLGGPCDQRTIEARPDVLLYAGAALTDDMEVTGPITVHLWASSSAPDTDFVARLVDIAPDGYSLNLTDGIVRARYREASTGAQPTLIEPGQPYLYIIDLWATSNVFKAGHRIGLQVTSSCFPRWDRNPNTGHDFGVDAELQIAHQEILHDREHPSHVVLPIVGHP